MENLPNGLSGWTWWITSVVVVGIAINLISSFLYPRLEKKIGQYSESQRKENEEKEKLFIAQVETVKSNSNKLLELKIDVIRLQLHTIWIVAIGILLTDIVPVYLQSLTLSFPIATDRALLFNSIILTGYLIIPMVTLVIALPVFNKTRYYQRLLAAAIKNPNS